MTQTVTMPNGDTLSFPDDTAPSVMEAFVKNHAAKSPAPSPDDFLPDSIMGIPLSKSIAAGIVGAGRTVDRQLAGIKQAYYGATDQPDKQAALAQTQQSNTQAYDPLAAAHPVSTFIGEAAPAMLTANPVAMGAMAANEYGSPEERAIRGGLGFAGGKIGQGVARAFGPKSMAGIADNGVSDFLPNPGGNQWGIPLTVGQATQNKPAQIAESVLANLPFGGAVNKARDASYQGFNRAVSNTFGDNTAQITPQVLGDALDRSGKQIGDIMQRAKAEFSPEHAAAASDLSRVISDLGPDGSVLDKKMGAIVDGMTNGNAMSGKTLRMMDSSLGRLMGSDVGDVRYAAANLQNIVRDAAAQSLSAEDQAALKLARQQNFNVRQVADAAKGTPAVGGGVEGPPSLSPAQLLTQVNKYQRNARYGGGNDLAELAQWAKGTLPDKIPNSGTTQRQFYQRLLTNPVGAGAGLVGIGYGADKAGLDVPPWAASGALLPLLAARGLAGRPVSEATRRLLARVGGAGLLGSYDPATQ